ncbi:MAG: hypothetical protein M0Q51_13765 [Bacteroidales bacterium]|nr:hypothetical protein [Bacteroidales bacterium]
MNRKIYILLTVLLAWSFGLKAQTAQIESLTANPGATVSFDIDVAGLPTNVGAVSLFIGYDPNVLTFTSSTGPELPGYILNNMIGTDQIGIQWTDPYGADINGTPMVTLTFQYSALGGTCDLTFDPGCEFADTLLNSITVAYTNGGIGPNAGIATIIIDEILANAGPVSLGVTGNGFTGNAGAVTLFIEFDPSILQFTSYTTTLPMLSISGNNTTGLISVAYSSTSGSSLDTTFLTLNFNYNATGTSELVFTGGCEIAYTNLSLAIVSYDNGKVEPLATAYRLTIEDEMANPGNPVGIGITALGYPDTVGAITLFIGYNPAHLTFLSLSNGTVIGALASVVSPGLLGITWTNVGGQGIDGVIFTMNFDYNFGSSDITFEGGCDISDITLTSIPTTYIDGSISPITGGAEVSMPVKTGTVGQPIDFPVRAKNFSMDIAAISLFIGFDNSVLTYTGHTAGTITGYFINYISATSQIGVQWTFPGGVDIDPNGNDTLFTLHFNYNGGQSNLTFDAGCEFAKPDLTTAPVSFFDGAVISGFRFNIKAFLEGPFDTTTVKMDTLLNLGGYLPLAQPYSGVPWNYAGTENVGSIPNANVVDWVLLEFRDTPGAANTATSATMVARQAAFLLNDGTIVGLDGTSEVLVPTVFTDNIYVVVYHRNHIRVMSANALSLVNFIYVYDFTDALAKAYNSGQKALGSYFGMYSADIDNDGNIFASDIALFVAAFPSFSVYHNADLDMDGNVFASDVNFMIINFPTFTTIP